MSNEVLNLKVFDKDIITLNIDEKITSGGGMDYIIGSGLKVTSGDQIGKKILSVDTVNDAEKDNTLPITSAAVYTELGNIDILLQDI